MARLNTVRQIDPQSVKGMSRLVDRTLKQELALEIAKDSKAQAPSLEVVPGLSGKDEGPER
ncbi:MAG: hypothetical protein OSB62_04675 [Alphaproteobacteria bacterium]|nr:hypothetical protein [Alphaproteobacteria bacterium]